MLDGEGQREFFFSFVIASGARQSPLPHRDCFGAFAPRNDKGGMLLPAFSLLSLRAKRGNLHCLHRDCFGTVVPRNDKGGSREIASSR